MIADDSSPKRYRIESSDVAQEEVSLSFKDRCALSMAVQAALSDDGFFLKEDLLNAARKLGIDLPEMEIEASNTDASETAWLIADAKSRGRSIEFEYEPAGRKGSRLRYAMPISLFTYHGDWYLSALDLDIDELRTFKLARMKSIAIGVRSDAVAQADNPILFPFQIGTEGFNAKIFIGGELANRIPAITWGKGDVEWQSSGALWTIEARDSHALASWVLENGPGIMLLEPKPIAASVAEHLRSIISSLGAEDD
ncbi:MAG: WYL domain-containing protein [bacterium]|nr:WYL domain-containing protein [bacterium]